MIGVETGVGIGTGTGMGIGFLLRDLLRGSLRASLRASLRGAAVVLLLLFAGDAAAQTSGGGSHLLVISGLEGEEKFTRDWTTWGAQLTKAAAERYGLASRDIVWLAEDSAAHPSIRGRSTKANIEREVRAIASRAGAGDHVMIVIFAHGAYQGGESRLNLPGPDITAAELALLLDGLRDQRVAVVNTGSASGGFVGKLAAPGRIVVTATKSGMEANETVFGKYFTAALTGDAADTDKDGRVSLLEAYEFSRLEVEREYQRGNKLLTEHAVLDAVGDGRGTNEVAEASPHAAAARAFHLGVAGGAGANASPELRALFDEKARIEAALDALRARRASMQEAAYETELEKLILELSRNAQAIRRAQGGS